MKKYLSFGGGVNSTALLLLLKERGEEFETIFVNHGGDYPETYEYVEYLRGKGFEITEIIPDIEGCNSIEDYIRKFKILPLRMLRWCTDKFKIRPIRKYIKTPCIMFIGFDWDEKKRSFTNKSLSPGVKNVYPLIENRITRQGCKEIIKKHNLKVPKKSGCYFCPFMKKEEIINLRLKYPKLYEKVKELENIDKKGYFFRNIPIETMSLENIKTLDNFGSIKQSNEYKDDEND